MGLDVVLYNKNKNVIGLFEISEDLHKSLFGNNNWRSYLYLRKINDYYTSKVKYSKPEINLLSQDLENMKQYIDSEFHSKIDELKNFLLNTSAETVHIAGD